MQPPLLRPAEADAVVILPDPTLSPEPGLGEPPLTLDRAFREHAPKVYNLARRMLGNSADAEDVTQDVFLQVVRKLAAFRGEAAFATWLYRIAINTALTYRRRRAVRERHRVRDPLESFSPDGAHVLPVRHWVLDAEQIALEHEAQEQIERAVAGLPEVYRDVFVLADVEGLPNADIGRMLALSLPAVKSRLHRARLMMRKALAPYFEEAAA